MPATRHRDFLFISLLWLPLNLFWSAMLVQVLPARVLHFVKPIARAVLERQEARTAQAEGRRPEPITGEQVDSLAALMKGTYLSRIGALGAVISTLIQLLIGPLSDHCGHRWGRRKPFLVVGLGLNTFALLAFAGAGSFTGLMVAFAGIQLLINIAMGPYQAYIPDLVPVERQGLASSYMGMAQLLGQSGGLVLGGLFLEGPRLGRLSGQSLDASTTETLGTQIILWLCAGLLLLALGLTAWQVRETPLPREQRLAPLQVLREAFDLRLRQYPDFKRLLISRFVINLGAYTGIQFIQYYVQDSLGVADYKVQTMWIGLTVGVGAVLGTFLAGPMADYYSKRRLIYFSCGTASACLAVFCLTYSLAVVKVVAFLFGVAYGAFCVTEWAFAANLIPEGGGAKYMAIWHIAFTVPQVIVPILGGRIGDAVNRAATLHTGLLGAVCEFVWPSPLSAVEHVVVGPGWRAVSWTAVFYLLLGTVLIRRVRERREIDGRDT
jgi:MFS family permease